MASVYILYSSTLNKYYTGSCKDHSKRLEEHLSELFPKAYTAKAKDWCLFFVIDNLEYLQARKIEAHIKRMKSRKFIENLKKYPEIQERLIKLYP